MRAARVLAALPAGVIGAALLVRLFDEWWSYLPAGIVDDLRRDLGVSYARAGSLLTLLFVGGFAGNALGILADHVSRRATAVVGAVFVAGGLATFAASSSYLALAAASVVMGAASDLLIRPIEAAITDEHGARLDRILGWQHTLSWFGDVIGPLLLGAGAATALGWRGAFAITSVAMLGFAAYLATVRFPAPSAPVAGGRAALAETLAVLRHRAVWRVAAAELVLGPLDEPFLAFVVARAAAQRAGAGHAAAQVLAGAVAAGGIAGSSTVARRGLSAATRRAGPPLLLAGAVLAIVNAGLVVTAAGMVLVGAGMGLAWASIHHRMLTVVPGRAATVSSIVGLLDTPGLLMPIVAGVVADRAGLTAALTIYLALAAALVILAPSH